MSPDGSNSYYESLLGARKLREMIREARGGFAFDHIARLLRYQDLGVIPEDAAEVCELLRKLIDTARDRLRDVGIEPEYDESIDACKLPKREREYVSNLAVLLTYLADVEHVREREEEAYGLALEGLAWCRIAHDYRQQSILRRVEACIYEKMGKLEDEERAYRQGVEAARRAKDALQVVAGLESLSALLVVRYRLDEAEAVNTEALALLREEVPPESRRKYYAPLLMQDARIRMARTQYADSIQVFREALRWADGDTDPVNRAAIMVHLGSVYLRLDHYQQSIECQHEVVRLAAVAGWQSARGWGYYRLAEAHIRLEEFDQAAEMLDRAEEHTSGNTRKLLLVIAAKRAQILIAWGRPDEAADICAGILEKIAGQPMPDLEMYAYKTLADIAESGSRDEEAVEHYRRAIEISDRDFSERSPTLEVRLAEVLHRLGRNDEVKAMLDAIMSAKALNPTEQVKGLRLRAAIAENAGEMQGALDYEREAFAVERSLLERRAEISLRNARIVAETDLLEREAELERDRRHRVERELAEATVALSDRKRMVEMVEEKLRNALEGMSSSQERSVINTLRETLVALRSQSNATESPLRYLSGADEDFYRRLRRKYPNLTSKQERLCGLLRAGLASKEISTLLALEPEGLKAQRKRLRKRLGIGPEERLEAVLGEV